MTCTRRELHPKGDRHRPAGLTVCIALAAGGGCGGAPAQHQPGDERARPGRRALHGAHGGSQALPSLAAGAPVAQHHERGGAPDLAPAPGNAAAGGPASEPGASGSGGGTADHAEAVAANEAATQEVPTCLTLKS